MCDSEFSVSTWLGWVIYRWQVKYYFWGVLRVFLGEISIGTIWLSKDAASLMWVALANLLRVGNRTERHQREWPWQKGHLSPTLGHWTLMYLVLGPLGLDQDRYHWLPFLRPLGLDRNDTSSPTFPGYRQQILRFSVSRITWVSPSS